jgi:EpsI family protein
VTQTSVARILVVIVVLVATRYVIAGTDPVVVSLERPLSAFPLELAGWRGEEGPDLDEELRAVLGADDYLNRFYENGDRAMVGLYVAYYAAQRQGDTIHSPQHCLPGNGWHPIEQGRINVEADGRRFPVNRYLVEKRGNRQLVLYWFQGRGHVVASEYTNKLYLLGDALRSGRTDGALIRVVTPVGAHDSRPDDVALGFVRALLPHLTQWLP